MSASCQKIDLPSWPRKDIFSFFSVLDQPFYSVCFRVDVTQLHTYTKTHGLSFYYVMTYLVTQAVNEVENLRYTIRNDSVFLLDKRTPSFTELKRAASSSRSSRVRVKVRWRTSAAPRRSGAKHRPRFWSRPLKRMI